MLYKRNSSLSVWLENSRTQFKCKKINMLWHLFRMGSSTFSGDQWFEY